MLPILRSRHTQVLVVLVTLLCTLLSAEVLTRTPAPVLAEAAVSSVLTIDEGTALAVVNTSVVNLAACRCSFAVLLTLPAPRDFANPLLLEYAVLRL